MRGSLLRLSETEHVVLLTLHHIVSDGWSIGVFINELAALYNSFVAGTPLLLPELPIQYADFAIWQRERLREETLEGGLSYWKQKLDGAPLVLDPRPITRGRRYRVTAAHHSLFN
jgi:hypothetical protein